MSGGYANIYDTSALSETIEGIADLSTDLTSATETVEIDRDDYRGGGSLLEHAEVLVPFEATIATPAAGDGLDVTVELLESAAAAGAKASLDPAISKTVAITTDTNTTITGVVSVPFKLLKADRYIAFDVTIAMTSGSTGTLSAATGGAVIKVFPMNRQPSANYSVDGYANTTQS